MFFIDIFPVNDVFEESTNSVSASTKSTSTPTKKRASTLAIEDFVPQLSSKKLKGDVSLLVEEDGQLSSTKSKPKVVHVTKDDCAKPSSTKQKSTNLIFSFLKKKIYFKNKKVFSKSIFLLKNM